MTVPCGSPGTFFIVVAYWHSNPYKNSADSGGKMPADG